MEPVLILKAENELMMLDASGEHRFPLAL